MKAVILFAVGLLCGCLIVGGVASARSSRASISRYPALHLGCIVADGQFNCFTVRADGTIIKGASSIAVSNKIILVEKHGVPIFSTSR